MRVALAFLPLLFASPVSASADQDAKKDPIIVTGNRAEKAEMTADTAKAITLRPPVGKPLPKHYEPACIKVFGIDAEYAGVLAERMRDNLGALGLILLGKGCTPTIWVGFAPDSHAAVTGLRKTNPRIFGDLHDYEIDKVLAGSKAAQAWFAREDKGVDGKAFKYRIIQVRGREVSVRANEGWKASRITDTIRVDMIGSIVIFDRKLSAGRTLRQLADYATFRALAPVSELSDEPGQPLSILTLFAENAAPPAGLTEFDWAYLAGYYKLGEHADVAHIHDAAKRAFLDELGWKKADKAGLPVVE